MARLFGAFTAAFAAAAAARSGRQPQARHLAALGIDPEDYRAIGRYRPGSVGVGCELGKQLAFATRPENHGQHEKHHRQQQ